LSFKSNQTILALPSDRDIPAPAPHASVGFSRAFAQASIEELCVIREWRIAIVNAVGSNSPASEEWISTQHRLAEKNLALACVGCFVFTSGLRSFAIGKEGLQTGASIRAAGPARKTLAGISFKSAA
jgi:hypothetical protein